MNAADTVPKFEYSFREGESLVLRDVKVGVPFAPLEAVNIGSGDQEVLYFYSYISVGNNTMHQFIQRSDQEDSVDIFKIRDEGISEVVGGVVIAKPEFGYACGKYSPSEYESSVLRRQRVKALELLSVKGR
jgi:hypothetical protein